MAPEHAQLRLRRTGGLAGLPVEASLDTRDLSEAEAREILGSLDSVDLDRVEASEDWPPGAADTFEYQLEVHRGDATHTATFSDRQVPDELVPIVRALMARARPSQPRG
jgi:hypothetical protein